MSPRSLSPTADRVKEVTAGRVVVGGVRVVVVVVAIVAGTPWLGRSATTAPAATATTTTAPATNQGRRERRGAT